MGEDAANMENPSRIFFCDNCSTFRSSRKHRVRITKQGNIITLDICDYCGVTQEVEIVDDRKKPYTHRIKSWDQKDDKRETK